MRFGLTMLLVTACGPVQHVVVSPSEAGDLSAEYHDRIVVDGIRHASGSNETLIGALIDDGMAVVTARNRRIELEPDDRLMITIRYVDGDRPVSGAGVIRRDVSPAKMGSGLVVAFVGSLALAGTIVGANTNCVRRERTFASDVWSPGLGDFDASLCTFGWAWLGGAALTTLIVGIGLVVRGSLHTNLIVSPRGGSIALGF